MNPLQKLVKFLDEVMGDDGLKPRETLASHIVGELLGDYDGVYKGIKESNPFVNRIADLASDLERSNGPEDELDTMWLELKRLINNLHEDAAE